MKIKTKISAGLIFLFAALLGIIMLSLFYIKNLSQDAQNILKDNYESVYYMKRVVEGCDSLGINLEKSLESIDASIRLQENNMTETGEQQLTSQLRIAFERMKNSNVTPESVAEVRKLCFALHDLNMNAITAKSELTINSADNAVSYLIIVASVIGLLALTFVVNFPGYIADPIVALTASIKSIANKDYEERLRFDRKDEFRELAEAFNMMAEKMDEYEHSNLAKIIFEKKRIETIINRMSDPVIGLDEQKKVVFVNDQALALLDLNQNQIIGRYAPDVAVENDLFRSLLRINIRLNGEEKEKGNGMIKVAINGKENYFSRENIIINYKPTGEKSNVAIGEVILLKNITPFKELDLAKTNFIATISHELKTPIASLQMGIKLLHDNRVGSLNEEQLDIIQTLTRETARLSNLTHELLDLAQVETGNIKLNLQRISPHDIILHALEAVRFHADRKKVTIEVKEPENLPIILADMDKTTWVLVNLLTNAIRYSHESGTVLLDCSRVDGAVLFSVKDFGPGIESKYVSHLFEKFFQVPGTPSGTGLGLAISKEFIEAQRGSIEVRSEPGKGSQFSFRLGVA